MLQEAFKEEALSQLRVYEWFYQFKRGDMSLEDQPRSGLLQQAEPTNTFKKFAMQYLIVVEQSTSWKHWLEFRGSHVNEF